MRTVWMFRVSRLSNREGLMNLLDVAEDVRFFGRKLSAALVTATVCSPLAELFGPGIMADFNR